MSFRLGMCSSCGANYKLPASFEADQARCKNCGGVVRIGKAGEPASPPPVPASKPVASAAASAVSKSKRKGPSMKERLIAERKAAEAGSSKATQPVPKVAASKPAAKPAAKPVAKPATSSSRSAARGTRASRKDQDGSEQATSSSRRSRSTGGGRRRAAPEKKPLPMGALLGVLALILIGAGAAYWNMTQGSKPEPAVNAGDATTELAQAESAESAPEDTTTGSEDAAQADSVSEQAAEPTAEEAAQAEREAEKAAAAKLAAEAAENDPASVDLTSLDDFEPFVGTTPERAQKLAEWVETMMDPMAGAKGNRAKGKLVKAGREAIPIIINAFKRLDLADEDGFRSADVTQKALQEICNGNNFGWKYPSQEPEKFHVYDKKVIRNWAKAWDIAATDDKYWAKLAKLETLPDATEDDEDSEESVDDALDALDDF